MAKNKWGLVKGDSRREDFMRGKPTTGTEKTLREVGSKIDDVRKKVKKFF